MACRMLLHKLRPTIKFIVQGIHISSSHTKKTVMEPPAPNTIPSVDNIPFQQKSNGERNEENHYIGSGPGDNACIAWRVLLAKALA
jgi:hypothetical protein